MGLALEYNLSHTALHTGSLIQAGDIIVLQQEQTHSTL